MTYECHDCQKEVSLVIADRREKPLAFRCQWCHDLEQELIEKRRKKKK